MNDFIASTSSSTTQLRLSPGRHPFSRRDNKPHTSSSPSTPSHRPPEFYSHLIAQEGRAMEKLPEAAKAFFKYSEEWNNHIHPNYYHHTPIGFEPEPHSSDNTTPTTSTTPTTTPRRGGGGSTYFERRRTFLCFCCGCVSQNRWPKVESQ